MPVFGQCSMIPNVATPLRIRLLHGVAKFTEESYYRSEIISVPDTIKAVCVTFLVLSIV